MFLIMSQIPYILLSEAEFTADQKCHIWFFLTNQYFMSYGQKYFSKDYFIENNSQKSNFWDSLVGTLGVAFWVVGILKNEKSWILHEKRA